MDHQRSWCFVHTQKPCCILTHSILSCACTLTHKHTNIDPCISLSLCICTYIYIYIHTKLYVYTCVRTFMHRSACIWTDTACFFTLAKVPNMTARIDFLSCIAILAKSVHRSGQERKRERERSARHFGSSAAPLLGGLFRPLASRGRRGVALRLCPQGSSRCLSQRCLS